MAVDGDFANFRSVYDELTDEVDRARHQFLRDHLTNWFRPLDETSRVAQLVQGLQSGADFEKWLTEHGGLQGMSQSGIRFPHDLEQSLGIKLLLFRAFAEGRRDLDIATFGHGVMHVGKGPDESAHAVIEEIFMPMARELRRYLQRETEKEIKSGTEIPASDRLVTINHNSDAYERVIEAAKNLRRVLQEANNSFDTEAEKDQRVAEVAATERLLEAPQVRTEPVISLVRQLAHDATNKLKETLISGAVGLFLSALAFLLHIVWPYIVPPVY
jgi:hypothetical protein